MVKTQVIYVSPVFTPTWFRVGVRLGSTCRAGSTNPGLKSELGALACESGGVECGLESPRINGVIGCVCSNLKRIY